MITAVRARRLLTAAAVAVAVTGCSALETLDRQVYDTQPDPALGAEPTLSLVPRPFEQIEGWADDDHAAALPALLQSCARWDILPPDRAVGPSGLAGTVADWQPVCDEARRVPATDRNRARYFFESQFDAFELRDRGARAGLMTGYYEAALRGSWEQRGAYTVPILSRPADLVSVDLGAWREEWRGTQIAGHMQGQAFVPFPTRAEIEDGALDGRQLAILYVDDPVDAFVLHIQGSGRVAMSDGGEVRVGYAGRNGHRYYAIGRELVARGVLTLDQVSMPAIRAWLKANPVAGREVMRMNKSYIFFRVLSGPGPVGAMGAPLTPERSIAVDPAFLPLGAPVFVSFRHPVKGGGQVNRLTLAQDTGSAIKGPLRADFFWGHGDSAAYAAGVMKADARFVLLLPKAVGARYRPEPPPGS
jgi:membrane-bound lytic murein transglycosylase A